MGPFARWGPRLRWHWPMLPGLLLGAFLRFHGLLPTYLYGDEAEYAAVARSLSQDPRRLAYPDLEELGPRPFVSQPPVMLYVFALAGRWTGDAENGPVLASALLGTATILLVYGLGVRLRGRAVGGLAALFLAVLPIHVSLSRKAMLDTGFTLFFTLTVLLYLVWFRRRSVPGGIGLGLSAAATALSKLPGLIVVVPLLAALAWEFRRARRQDLAAATGATPAGTRWRVLREWAVVGVPLALSGAAYLGLLVYLRATRDLAEKLGWQFGRVAGTPAAGGSGFHRHWEWYFTDSNFGLPAQLGLVLTLLALGGLGLLLVGLRRGRAPMPEALVVLAWVAVVLGFFTVSDRKEWFYIVPLMPAAALLAAVAADALRRKAGLWLERRRERSWRRPATVAVALLAAVAAVGSFAPAQESASEFVFAEKRYGMGVKEAALWIEQQDSEAAQIGTILGRFTLHFYNGNPTYDWYDNHTYMENQIKQGRIRYVVEDSYLNLTYERVWMGQLVERFHGTPVGPAQDRVRVYELSP